MQSWEHGRSHQHRTVRGGLEVGEAAGEQGTVTAIGIVLQGHTVRLGVFHNKAGVLGLRKTRLQITSTRIHVAASESAGTCMQRFIHSGVRGKWAGHHVAQSRGAQRPGALVYKHKAYVVSASERSNTFQTHFKHILNKWSTSHKYLN